MSENTKPREELQLVLATPASPQRVATIAQMFAESLEAMRVHEGVTLVVNNFATDAVLRGWDDTGSDGVLGLVRVIREPTAAADGDPRLRTVARQLAKHGRRLARDGGRFLHNSVDISPLNERFVDVMESAGREGTETRHAGTTEFCTPILRFGRARIQQGQPKVRIVVGTRAFEASFNGPDAARKILAEAAETTSWCRIQVEAGWVKNGDVHEIVQDSMVITDARSWNALAGAASLTKIDRVTETTSAWLLDQLEGD